MTTYIIIDANNLANFVFEKELEKDHLVTLRHDAILIEALRNWAEKQSGNFYFDYCPDLRPEKPKGNAKVEVWEAKEEGKADSEIYHRAAVHFQDGDTCYLITSDGPLRKKIYDAYGVKYLPSSAFVLSRDPGNVLFYPIKEMNPVEEFEDSINEYDDVFPLTHLSENDFVQSKGNEKLLFGPPAEIIPVEKFEGSIIEADDIQPLPQNQIKNQRRENKHCKSEDLNKALDLTLAKRQPVSPSPVTAFIQEPEPKPDQEPKQEPIPLTVQLTFDTWPFHLGEKFLRDSFCNVDFRSIQQAIENLQVNDIPALAKLLLENCGQESDFISRGGCLMDRVRLALLRAENMQLTFPELVELTGDKQSDIKKKVMRSKNPWLKC